MATGGSLDLEWFDMAPGEHFESHVHDKHQLAWASGGAVLIEVEDRCWVLPPYLALWIPAGRWHRAAAVRTSRLLGLYLEVDASPIAWAEPTVVAVPPLARHLIEYLDADLDDPAWARASAVLVDVLAPVDLATLEVPLPVDRRAAAVAELLLADPADRRGLEELARVVHTSPRTLLRVFGTETGMTFADWRLRVRVQAAVAMLAEGEPVNRVAGRVGYATPSAFVAAFRRVAGSSPLEYVERELGRAALVAPGESRDGEQATRPGEQDAWQPSEVVTSLT